MKLTLANQWRSSAVPCPPKFSRVGRRRMLVERVAFGIYAAIPGYGTALVRSILGCFRPVVQAAVAQGLSIRNLNWRVIEKWRWGCPICLLSRCYACCLSWQRRTSAEPRKYLAPSACWSFPREAGLRRVLRLSIDNCSKRWKTFQQRESRLTLKISIWFGSRPSGSSRFSPSIWRRNTPIISPTSSFLSM